MTGSANLLTLRSAQDSLAGRVERVELWPMSQAELRQSGADLVAKLLASVPPRLAGCAIRFERHVDEILRMGSGFIEAHRRSAASRARWLDAYLQSLLGRDVEDLAELRDPGLLQRLLELVAGCAGGQLVVSTLANQLGRDAKTIQLSGEALF